MLRVMQAPGLVPTALHQRKTRLYPQVLPARCWGLLKAEGLERGLSPPQPHLTQCIWVLSYTYRLWALQKSDRCRWSPSAALCM